MLAPLPSSNESPLLPMSHLLPLTSQSVAATKKIQITLGEIGSSSTLTTQSTIHLSLSTRIEERNWLSETIM